MGNSRRAPHSRAGLLPTQLNLSGRASRAALDGFRCFLFSNACRRCIPRGWALFCSLFSIPDTLETQCLVGFLFSRSAFLEYLFRKAGWDLAKRGHRTQAPPAPAYRCLRFVFRKSGGNHRPFCQIACRGRMDFRHRANCVCLRWMGHRHRHLS